MNVLLQAPMVATGRIAMQATGARHGPDREAYVDAVPRGVVGDEFQVVWRSSEEGLLHHAPASADMCRNLRWSARLSAAPRRRQITAHGCGRIQPRLWAARVMCHATTGQWRKQKHTVGRRKWRSFLMLAGPGFHGGFHAHTLGIGPQRVPGAKTSTAKAPRGQECQVSDRQVGRGRAEKALKE